MSRSIKFTSPVYLGEPLPDPLPAEVVEVDDEAVLRAHFALFEQSSRPAVELRPLPPEGLLSLGGSRLGGCPDLPEGMEWPRHQGRPLAFIAQVNLAEAAPHDPLHELPPSGLLSFFYELEGGSGWGAPEHAACLRVLYAENISALSPRPHPESLPASQRLAAQPVQLAAALIPPDCNEFNEEQVDAWLKAVPEGNHVSYRPARAAWRGESDISRSGYGYLLGWPDCLLFIEDMRCTCAEIARMRSLGYETLAAYLERDEQASEEEEESAICEAARDWVLLAQLRLPANGLLDVWIRRQELAARDFSKVWFFRQAREDANEPNPFY